MLLPSADIRERPSRPTGLVSKSFHSDPKVKPGLALPRGGGKAAHERPTKPPTNAPVLQPRRAEALPQVLETNAPRPAGIGAPTNKRVSMTALAGYHRQAPESSQSTAYTSSSKVASSASSSSRGKRFILQSAVRSSRPVIRQQEFRRGSQWRAESAPKAPESKNPFLSKKPRI